MQSDPEKLDARAKLSKMLTRFEDYEKNEDNKRNFRFFNFDLLLTNPPFAGEIRQNELLKRYELARNSKGKIPKKVERDILFIERDLNFIKPGGRMAIVLPQGKFNNTSTEYIRKYLFEKARILAVVGLNTNTFKLPAPAKGTGTKTSILFLQKWAKNEEPLEDYPILWLPARIPERTIVENIFIKKMNMEIISKIKMDRKLWIMILMKLQRDL